VTASIAQRAYQLLCEQHTLVVIDIETTPADDGDHIVQLAAVTVRQGRIRRTYATEINPGVPITNSQFHNLTDADVAEAPAFGDIIDRLESVIGGDDTILVCHNAAFDIGRLHLEYARLGTGQTLPDRRVLDTVQLPDAVGHVLPSRSRKLAAVCTSLGIDNANPHTAAGDATATAEALLALLRVAASNGQTNLDRLHLETGARTTTSIATSNADSTIRDTDIPELPEAHLATHSKKPLGKTAANSTLKRWTDEATACVELRCRFLDAKATVALHHAAPLHDRLTDLLTDRGASLEPGQGGTLVGALNILAPAALLGGPKSKRAITWWKKHRPAIQTLARCGQSGACPACQIGEPCPLDIAHQPIATTILFGTDDRLSDERRKKVSAGGTDNFLHRWTKDGCHDLAGYAAWLTADSWIGDGNRRRADAVIDQAMTLEAYDPQIIRVYAERLTLQNRHNDAKTLATTHLQARTTDPGWKELADWCDRSEAHRRAARPAPNPKPGTPTRIARPAGRVRKRRFTA
jgi:DNA polymerase III epsilon subunit family exonuclease